MFSALTTLGDAYFIQNNTVPGLRKYSVFCPDSEICVFTVFAWTIPIIKKLVTYTTSEWHNLLKNSPHFTVPTT